MNKKILIILSVSAAILLALGVWFYFRNIYSREILKLEILGPSEIEAGERIEYIVKYKNNGDFRLEEPVLTFELSENSVLFGDFDGEEFKKRGERKVEVSLEDIYPGAEKVFKFEGMLLGKEGDTAVAKAWLNYKPKNLSLKDESETSLTTIISGVPLSFDVHFPTKAESGERFNFEINYFSKIDYPLSDLRVQIEYPSGFQFIDSRPRPNFENSEWEVNVLNQAQGGRIEISGILKGNPQEVKIFKASIGFWIDGRFVLLKETTRGIELATPLIYITHQINGNPGQGVSQGEYLYYEIFFRNTGEDLMEKLFMTARLNDNIFDFNTVQPGSGTFQKNSGMIIWDSSSVSQLEFLPPGEQGKIDFWVKIKDNIETKNPEARIEIAIKDIKETIVSKINTKLIFSQKGYFSQSPFSNFGSNPPKVGSPTSYTVHWQIKNNQNDVNNVKIKAILPSHVRLSENVSPESAEIFFDSVSREIVWDVGFLSSKAMTEVYFQIIFDPQPDHKGESVDLIYEANVSANDLWTNTTLRSSYKKINTSLIVDKDSSEKMGIVQ